MSVQMVPSFATMELLWKKRLRQERILWDVHMIQNVSGWGGRIIGK